MTPNVDEPGGPVGREELLSAQPPARHEPDALARIRDAVIGSGRRVIVLDDDPTGTQTVHDVPVLTTWSYSELRWALEQPNPTVFVLTNSRSLDADEAAFVNRQIAERLIRASGDSGTDFVLTSRSDSTLRGHYVAETSSLREVLETDGRGVDGIVVCPCFFEAGRVTVDDVQWVEQDGEFVPAAQTEFASDATFGYAASDLKGWIEERTGGEVGAKEVLSISLDDIRKGGPERVAELLSDAKDARPVVVNAAEYADLEVFVLGLLAAEARGQTFVYRVGPSFVRVRGGIPEKEPLTAADLHRHGSGAGLVLVGSHVALTTRQLEKALQLDGIHAVELSVGRLLEEGSRADELDRVIGLVDERLGDSDDVVVYTSREVVGASGGLTGLEVGAVVSDALVEVARRVDRGLALGFVIAKGGITSSDVATRGFNVRRAVVAGQMKQGIISAWVMPADSDYPGVPYVVFPGNVGGPDALAEVIQTLREGGQVTDVTQKMRGFDEFRDIVHYIEKSTYQIWDEKNLGLIYRYYTPATVVHTSDGDVFGYEEVVRNSTIKMAAFPDIRDLIEDVVWTGNDRDGYRTSMRWTWTARNTGPGVYGPPTNRQVVVSGLANCIIRGENVVEEWVAYNELSLLGQLGLDVMDVLREASSEMEDTQPIEPVGEIDRLAGQAPPPELPPKETAGFDVEDFVRRSFHDVYNRRMFGKITEYYAPNFLCHGASDREFRGTGEFTRDVLARVAAFPDATMHIDDLYWNDDGGGRYRTAVLWTMLGTHDGPGIYGPPTGRRVRIMGITHHLIRGGRFVEEWTEFSEFSLMKRLLLPLPSEPLASEPPPERVPQETYARGGDQTHGQR